MEERRCTNCGLQLHGCPNCKQKLDKHKPIYSPEGHMMTQLTKPMKRGRINPIPSR